MRGPTFGLKRDRVESRLEIEPEGRHREDFCPSATGSPCFGGCVPERRVEPRGDFLSQRAPSPLIPEVQTDTLCQFCHIAYLHCLCCLHSAHEQDRFRVTSTGATTMRLPAIVGSAASVGLTATLVLGSASTFLAQTAPPQGSTSALALDAPVEASRRSVLAANLIGATGRSQVVLRLTVDPAASVP